MEAAVKKLFFYAISILFTFSNAQLNVVYNPNYNITFYGLLSVIRLHSFNGKKYGEIYKVLRKNSKLKFHDPKQEISSQELLNVHSERYLDSLLNSENIARIAEVYPLKFVPNFLLRRALLRPIKYATQGTLDALDLALKYGNAINLGGGYHHAKNDRGEGFCFYSDIALAVNKFKEKHPGKKVMIVDLDVHQGNGHESIFMEDESVVIYDVYNMDVYPRDEAAKSKAKYRFPVRSEKLLGLYESQTGLSRSRVLKSGWLCDEKPAFSGIVDDVNYLKLISDNLSKAIMAEKPDLIIYIAGTDILLNDPLGLFDVSEQGVIKRDELVFQAAIENKIPILMLLAGGYTKESSLVISNSINNLQNKFF